MTGSINMMSPLTSWSNRLQMDLWILLYIILAVVPWLSHGARSSCPEDLQSHVHSCFSAYSIHSQILYNSPHKLCCGVDVETLRAFCHSYTRANYCVQSLRRACPVTQHPTIDKVLDSMDGQDKAGLMDLCQDDHVIEAYAMYQECFQLVGSHSERCFTSHLKDSSSIRFLSKVTTKHKETFCRNMRDTVRCVQRQVQQACGMEASGLAVLLVKPMVRDSSECDYSVEDKDPKDMDSKTTAYISDDSRMNREGKSGSSNSKNSNNRRRHKNKNTPYETNSNRGTNAESRSTGPHNGAKSFRLVDSSQRCLLFTSLCLLFTVVLKRLLTNNCWSSYC